jgi:ParB-like chromosome segregation protein Spo0J
VHIELWPIDRPKPYPKNARKWNAAAIAKVASSIREYGFRQPIVVDVHGVIVIGHLRHAAARSLGLPEVPVHIARDLTPEQIRGLRLADNRTNQEAFWDEDLLGPELADLEALGFDLGLTAFDVHELDKLLRDPLHTPVSQFSAPKERETRKPHGTR